MDLDGVLGIAGALQAQRTAALQLEVALRSVKGFQDLQQNVVARLLASLPDLRPDGVGGAIDLTA